MAVKYHVNDSGEPGKCSAKKNNCPFGSSEEHFESPDAAREAYETKMNDSSIPPKMKIQQPDMRQKMNELQRSRDDLWSLNEIRDSKKLDHMTDLIIGIREDLTEENYQKVLIRKNRIRYDIENRILSDKISQLKNEIKELENSGEGNSHESQSKQRLLNSAMREMTFLKGQEPVKLSDQDIEIAKSYSKIGFQVSDYTKGVLSQESLSNANLQKIAKSNQFKGRFMGYMYEPYEDIYDHPNSSQETKNIAIEKSITARRMKKLDDLAEKHGDMVDYLSVPNSKKVEHPFGENNLYTVSTLRFNKSKLKELELESDDVLLLMRRTKNVDSNVDFNPVSCAYTSRSDDGSQL